MSSLSFFYITQCCAHERRPKNTQNKVLAYAKTRLSFESQGNLQNMRANVHVMRREA